MDNLINWLLDGEPWVRYRTQIDLLGLSENDKEVVESKLQIMENHQIQNIINQACDVPVKPINSHKSAEHPIHKLSFLSDIGLTINDEPIKKITDRILQYQSDEGAFLVTMNIPKHFGGTGENQLAWALCDAPLILYSLIKFGLQNHPQIEKSVNFLVDLISDNGYPCKVSKELGKFRGPGKKTDPCPYSNLLMLKIFSCLPDKYSKECSIAIDCQLDLWENSLIKHPYMFYAGTDFRKLKAPFVWYDILHVLDVLTQFKHLQKNTIVLQMAELLRSKQDNQNKYTPESIWKSWVDFDFGQKKQPSPWVTFLATRLLKRLNN